MARRGTPKRTAPAVLTAAGAVQPAMQQVSGNAVLAGSASVFKPGRPANPSTDRQVIAKSWQVQAYRHINICGEARYAATQFASTAGKAEIGVSKPDSITRKPVWVTSGPEVDAFAEIAPNVRARSKLIRDFMLHWEIAGECYLIARERVDTDPGYIAPPSTTIEGEEFKGTWAEYVEAHSGMVDVLDSEADQPREDPNQPIWEIVAVTELMRVGSTWKVKHDNATWLDLDPHDPVIRMWNPDPEDRREAWSPFRSLLPTLAEIEFLTRHIFTQVRSRLMSAGVWFLPDNLTFPTPPPEAIEGGAEAIARMNEAEQFMLSLAAASVQQLDHDEVAFPSIVMADPAALAAVEQSKLIKFWSDIDDKAMILRTDAIRRFALGMDLPFEQILGSGGGNISGRSASGGSGSGGANHWGEWAIAEKTISTHIEPALDNLAGNLTALLQVAVEETPLVIAYDPTSMRPRQDRSKESMELYDRGLLKGEVMVRENGFDPANDMMDDAEHKVWLLSRIVSGQATPEQIQAALILLGVTLDVKPLPGESGDRPVDPHPDPAPGTPGRNETPTLDQHPTQGPPTVQHDHSPAPFSAVAASCEGLVLRALEKSGNRLLNDGKRGRDKDRTTPPVEAHLTASINRTFIGAEFDFSMADMVLNTVPSRNLPFLLRSMGDYCAHLYNSGEEYSREGLLKAIGAVA